MPSPILVLNSQTHYVADGSTTTWDFNFAGGYISKDHVRAYKVEPGSDLIIPIPLAEPDIGEAQVSIIPAIADGASLVIYRDTPKDMPLVDYTNGQGYDEASLDTTAKQAVFIAAEVLDRAGQALNVGGGVAELQEVLLAAPGAGLVGFIPGTVYPANTVGATLTEAVDAIEALEAIPTNAVDKDAVTEQVMNGDLTIQQDSARLRLQQDTTPTKTFDIVLLSDGSKVQLIADGGLVTEVVGDLTVTGTQTVANQYVAGQLSLGNAGALLTAVSGSEIDVQPGALLRVRDNPTIAEGAANKRYVDQCYSSKFYGNGVSTTYGGDGVTYRHVEFTVGPISDCTIGTGIISTRPTVLSPNTGVTGVARIRVLIKMTHVSGTQATFVKFRIHDGFTSNNPDFSFALTAGSMTTYQWVDVSTQLQGVGATLRFGLSGADGSTNVSFTMLAGYTELYHQPT